MPDPIASHPTQPNLRPARAEDLDAVCAIARRAWVRIHDSFRERLGEELHQRVAPDWERAKEAALRRHWELHPDWMWVVTVDDHVEGFFTYSLDHERRIGTIGNNAVDPSFQSGGLGTAMYARVLDLFRDAGMEYAHVRTGLDEGHAPARRAYEKAGFDLSIPDVTYYRKL
jgi:GNAT superfamily N-acetyltransferase